MCPNRAVRGAVVGGLLAVLLGGACSSGLSGTGRAPAAAVAPPTAVAPGGAGAASSAAPALRAKIAFTAFSPSYAPWWVAQEAGYYREQGLEVELLQVAGGPTLLAAMRSGELDLAAAGGGHIVLGYVQGLETLLIGSTANTLEGSVLARPGLQTVQDLRGKTVGMTRPNSISDTTARLGLQRVGLQPDVDVTLIGTGGNAESRAALEAGLVDAASVNAPFTFELRKGGYRDVLNVSEMKIPFLLGAIGATRATLEERPELADRTLRSLAQATRRIQTDRDLAVRVLGQYTRIDDQDLLGATVDLQQGLYQPDLYPDPQAVQAVLDAEELPAARTARPHDVTDYRFVERLRQSGFLERLPQ
jgi:NitT/TauT family transport system substrate-binding protein